MWPFKREKNYVVYKPKWANSVLAYNYSFRKCDYDPCGRIIKDGAWFKIFKANSHYLNFDTKYCELAYIDKHGPKPEKEEEKIIQAD